MADESESVGKLKEKNVAEEVVGDEDSFSFEDALEEPENDNSFTENDNSFENCEEKMNEEEVLNTDSSRECKKDKENTEKYERKDNSKDAEDDEPSDEIVLNGSDVETVPNAKNVDENNVEKVIEDIDQSDINEVEFVGNEETVENRLDNAAENRLGNAIENRLENAERESDDVDDEIEVVLEDSPVEREDELDEKEEAEPDEEEEFDEEDEDGDEEENVLNNVYMYESQGGLMTILETEQSRFAHRYDVPPPHEGEGDDSDSGDSDGVIMFTTPIKSPDDDLPETVTKLDTAEGASVYVVGTAHFSEKSQDDVAKTIQAVQPDIVMVELCRGRVEILMYDEAFLLKEVENMNLEKIKMCIRQNGLIGGLMHLLLLNMSAHISKQIGMAPGGEFRTAFHEHRKVPGCQFHLGDRPVQITLSRVMGALSVWQKMTLGWHLLTSQENITKEDIEKGKEKDFLAEMLAEMVGDFPKLYEVFVSERDKYMAHTLRVAASPQYVHTHEENRIVYQCRLPKVVAVVGIGHVNGIKDNWDKEVDIQELMTVPGPSRAGQFIRFFGKATLVVFLSWSTYKLFHWTNLTSLIGNYVPLPDKLPFF